ALAVTIDDGRSGAVAWLLGRALSTKVNATVFVVPGWIDRPDTVPRYESYSGFGTWAEVTALRDAGHCIGSHGVTHRPLTTLPVDQIHDELRISQLRIRECVGIEPFHLSAPYGKV